MLDTPYSTIFRHARLACPVCRTLEIDFRWILEKEKVFCVALYGQPMGEWWIGTSYSSYMEWPKVRQDEYPFWWNKKEKMFFDDQYTLQIDSTLRSLVLVCVWTRFVDEVLHCKHQRSHLLLSSARVHVRLLSFPLPLYLSATRTHRQKK